MKNKILIAFLCIDCLAHAQFDSAKSSYFSKDGIQHTCTILLNKSKKNKNVNQYDSVITIDTSGIKNKFSSDNINGYYRNGIYYRSFMINYKGKIISFFAKELTSGKAVLYYYNGEKMNGEPIYIFKKKAETEFIFVQQNIQNQTNKSSLVFKIPDATGQSLNIMKFYDSEPYLNYFKNYLSDCTGVYTKFKSEWYTYDNIENIFKDYNKFK